MLPELQEQIKTELGHLRRLMIELEPLRRGTETSPPGTAEMLALGANLQSFYNGIENIFKRIDQHIDKKPKGGEAWHMELLEQMAQATEKRPAVISQELAQRLREYLEFRHVFRHVYGFLLRWERMAPLVHGVQETFQALDTEFLSFLSFLNQATEN